MYRGQDRLRVRVRRWEASAANWYASLARGRPSPIMATTHRPTSNWDSRCYAFTFSERQRVRRCAIACRLEPDILHLLRFYVGSNQRASYPRSVRGRPGSARGARPRPQEPTRTICSPGYKPVYLYHPVLTPPNNPLSTEDAALTPGEGEVTGSIF